jgi:hypothetical protein
LARCRRADLGVETIWYLLRQRIPVLARIVETWSLPMGAAGWEGGPQG